MLNISRTMSSWLVLDTPGEPEQSELFDCMSLMVAGQQGWIKEIRKKASRKTKEGS
jgi:hypothetical protein